MGDAEKISASLLEYIGSEKIRAKIFHPPHHPPYPSPGTDTHSCPQPARRLHNRCQIRSTGFGQALATRRLCLPAALELQPAASKQFANVYLYYYCLLLLFVLWDVKTRGNFEEIFVFRFFHRFSNPPSSNVISP